MDIIFVDTSIFESNNFFEGKRIKELYKLSKKGAIKVIVPKLTYDEIENRLFKNIDLAKQKFKKYRDETRVLRNVSSLGNKFDPFDVETVKREISNTLKETFKDAEFEIIEYPTLNIKSIFRSYFEKKFPFGSGGKKSEFPDAFALKSVELWAETQGVQILTFSKDNDMLNYESDHLKIVSDFGKYLSDKIKEVETDERHQTRLKEIDAIIENNAENIMAEIESWVRDQLDDYSNYYDYSNSYEVHDYEINEVNIDIEDYDITNVSEDFISVQLKLYINYKVQIIIDDEESMFRDYETKDWIFMDTKPVSIDEIRYINADLAFEIEPEDTTVYEPEIESINDDKKLNV